MNLFAIDVLYIYNLAEQTGFTPNIRKTLADYPIPYLPYVFGQTGLSKQFRPRWDAAERGVSSGSTLFATHPAIFRHNIG